MKEYPSIPSSNGQAFREIANAAIFDKLDGSNLRAEWNKKQGWYKFGRRHGLLDASNPHLLEAPPIFMERCAEELTRIAIKNRWQGLVVFFEFWGKESFAGNHVAGDPKFITIFDAAPEKKGFMLPNEFRKAFEDKVETARYLGTMNWTRGLVDKIKNSELDGITFEGVVAKAGSKHDIIRAKAKTNKWIDAVKGRYTMEEAEKILRS